MDRLSPPYLKRALGPAGDRIVSSFPRRVHHSFISGSHLLQGGWTGAKGEVHGRTSKSNVKIEARLNLLVGWGLVTTSPFDIVRS